MSSNGSMRVVLGLIVLGSCGFAQTFPGGAGSPGGGYPGQGPYPPGQGPYPQGGAGGPFPGGRTRYPDKQAQQVQTLTGVLRSISGSELVLESEHKTTTTVSLANSTKYFK